MQLAANCINRLKGGSNLKQLHSIVLCQSARREASNILPLTAFPAVQETTMLPLRHQQPAQAPVSMHIASRWCPCF